LNAIDAQKIGLVTEIINDGVSGRNQLIKKITTELAFFKLVKYFFYSFQKLYFLVV